MVSDESIDKRYIQSTLKRISSYYADRARIARKHAREADDVETMMRHCLSSLQWQAKYDTVHKVAENLEVVIPASTESNEPGVTVYTTDNRGMFIAQFLTDGLKVEGARHKQYFLCQLAEVLGLKELLADVEDKGHAP